MSKQKQQGKTNITWAAFIAIVLCIVVGNAVLALSTIQGLTQTQKSLDNTSLLADAIERLHLSIVQAESGQRGYLLTEEEDYLMPYYDAIGQIESQMEHVKSLHSEIDGQAERIAELLVLTEAKIKELKQTVKLATMTKSAVRYMY